MQPAPVELGGDAGTHIDVLTATAEPAAAPLERKQGDRQHKQERNSEGGPRELHIVLLSCLEAYHNREAVNRKGVSMHFRFATRARQIH